MAQEQTAGGVSGLIQSKAWGIKYLLIYTLGTAKAKMLSCKTREFSLLKTERPSLNDSNGTFRNKGFGPICPLAKNYRLMLVPRTWGVRFGVKGWLWVQSFAPRDGSQA